jgi:electron transport complex protein RnfG
MEANQDLPKPGPAWRNALTLGLAAMMGAGLLAGVNQLTRQRIENQERRAALVQLGQLLPPGRYDNALQEDSYSFRDTAWFPSGQTITVYRARMGAEPAAAIFRLAATDGYNGDINLLIGINLDGSLTGVRVLSHKETPGLGDPIETSRSNWILQFSGRSLSNPGKNGWAVKIDGGEFDQFTGATITPRAVVKAVRMTLEYFAANKNLVFAQPADSLEVAKPR